MKKLILLFTVSAFIVAIMNSCDEGTGTYTEDALLKKELIGTWHGANNGSVITFNKNGTYSESTYRDESFNETAIVVEGEYKIEDGQIIYSNSNFTYNIDASESGITKVVTFINPVWNIEVSGDSLTLTNTVTFIPDGSTEGIYGKWSADQIYVAYIKDNKPQFISGKSTLVLDIQKDTNLYNFRNYYIINNEEEVTIAPSYPYSYNEPFIIIDTQESPWGRLEEGKIIIDNEQRTYNRTK